MKHFFALLLLLSAAAFAQTTVTATVMDPNGNAYANGTASAYSVVASGQASTATSPVTTNGVGTFSMTLNAGTYIFTICAPPVQIGPLGNPTPKQICFSSQPVSISGASQDISSSLNPVAAVLGARPAQGTVAGSGSQNTIAEWGAAAGTLQNSNFQDTGTNGSYNGSGGFSAPSIKPGSSTFAGLGAPGNGTSVYCSDCQNSNPCSAGGSGAMAQRVNGAWQCSSGFSPPQGTTVSGSAITFPGNVTSTNGDMIALNHVATQPTDSLTFFTNPVLDPNCDWWNWSTSPPDQFLQLCSTTSGQLTSMFGAGNKSYYYSGPQQFNAYQVWGNPTGTAQGPQPTLINAPMIATAQYVTDTTNTNSYAGCPANTITTGSTVPDGTTINLRVSNTNTGTASFFYCSIGTYPIQKASGNLASGDINASVPAILMFKNPGNQWYLANPQSGATSTGPVTITEGTITANTPFITATATLNNGAVAFVNDSRTITCTAAAANSVIFQYIAGSTTNVNAYFNAANCGQFRFDIAGGANIVFRVDTGGNHIAMSNAEGLQWSTSSNLGASPTFDIGFSRFGAKTLTVCTNTACSDSAGLLLAGNTCRVTTDITLSTSSTTICTWSLPAVAQAWAWSCQIPWAVTAGTTPTIAIQVNPSQTPTGATNASAEIKTTNTNTATEATVALSVSGATTVLTSPTLTTSATVFMSSTSGTVLASGTAGTFAIQMIGTGAGFAGAAKAGATCTLN